MPGVSNLETCKCPKCGRQLKQSGELSVSTDGGDVFMPTFQCDECLVNVDFAGEQVEIALTFCRRPDGKLIDPASPDDELRLE